MKINRQELIDAIQKAAPLVKTRSTIPAISNVLIWAINGGFHVTATDLEAYIEVKCSCSGDLPECGVPAQQLLATLRQPEEFAELSVESNRRLKVSCGSVAILGTSLAAEFPAFPKDDLKAIGVNCEDLSEAIKSVAWAASDDKNKDIQCQCVWVNLDPKKKAIITAACDRNSLAYCEHPAIVPKSECAFLADNSGLICDTLLNESAELFMSDSWVVVKSHEVNCAVKLIEGKYLPVNVIVDIERENVGTVNRHALSMDLTTIMGISTDGFSPSLVTTSSKGLSLEFKSSINEFSSMIEGKFKDSSFRCDSKRLNSVLKNAINDTLELSVGERDVKLNGGDCSYYIGKIEDKK